MLPKDKNKKYPQNISTAIAIFQNNQNVVHSIKSKRIREKKIQMFVKKQANTVYFSQ